MARFLLIGQGIAGSCLTWKLIRAGNEVLVLDAAHPHSASKAAEGLMNPITGRKYVKSWLFDELFSAALKTYREMEAELGVSVLTTHPIYRFLHSDRDLRVWDERIADPDFIKYLENTDIQQLPTKYTPEKKGGFRIAGAAQLNAAALLPAIREFLLERGCLLEEEFDHSKLDAKAGTYRGEEFDHIIFAEGHRYKFNPLLEWLPIEGTKGQALEIKSDRLDPGQVFIGKKTLAPLPDGTFWYGGTFEWGSQTDGPTVESRESILADFHSEWDAPDLEICGQRSGVRPTTPDRRPIVGPHPQFPKLWVFNGMGTKGISLSPFLADCTLAELNGNPALPEESRVERFYHLYGGEDT